MPNIQLQPLLTMVVGSYPTEGLPPRRAIQQAVEDQVAAGLDLISDGEPRGDMIARFASRIPGIQRADDGAWEVTDPLDQPESPIAAPDYTLARELAARRAEVKGVVTGPVTLALALRVAPDAPYIGPQDPALILRLAAILGREVAALVACGARIVQADEPSLPLALRAGRVQPELASAALREFAAAPPLPALHVCGDIRDIAMDLLLLDFAIYSVENTAIPNLAAFDDEQLEFAGARVAAGCVSSADATVEEVSVIRERIRAALRLVPAERLWVAPDCGLRQLERAVASEKLARMVAAAQVVRADV
jgi:5-methyltetrahydropteroyltriglutamate--homocysteine methyltransferase